MRRYFVLASMSLLVFLISCDLLQPESVPTQDAAVLTETVQVSPESHTDVPTATVPLPDTPTPTITVQLPTNTPTSTPEPSSTPTPQAPTKTPTVTPTKRLVLKPTATPHLLGVQLGSPIGVSNFSHPELGCQWMGVAGQVFDSDGAAIEELVVEMGGVLAAQNLTGLTLTGSAPIYGPGGYEFKLSDEPMASAGTIWVQIYDLEGLPLSAPTYFNTYDDCDRNLILLNFVQAYTLPDHWAYLPVIYR